MSGNDRQSALEQGDIIALDELPYFSDAGGGEHTVSMKSCPFGVAVLNQTCDAIRRPEIQVAPIVELSGSDFDRASLGKNTGYVPVNLDGHALFADLSCIAMVARAVLEGCEKRGSGVDDVRERRLFRDLVARRFGRFPFPDAVVEWCRPLQDKVAPKARKHGSQGKLLRSVSAIRVEDANDWQNERSYELTLTFLLRPGVLPTVDEYDLLGEPGLPGVPGLPSGLPREIEDARIIKPLSNRANKLAELLAESAKKGYAPLAVRMLWQLLVDAWVGMCKQAYPEKSDVRVFGTGEVVSEDDYPYSRVCCSEQLDLDYLSRGLEDE